VSFETFDLIPELLRAVNEAGYTDERHALNTHASVLLIFSLLWSRVEDEEAKRFAPRLR
jgi:hypothetical protein